MEKVSQKKNSEGQKYRNTQSRGKQGQSKEEQSRQGQSRQGQSRQRQSRQEQSRQGQSRQGQSKEEQSRQKSSMKMEHAGQRSTGKPERQERRSAGKQEKQKRKENGKPQQQKLQENGKPQRQASGALQCAVAKKCGGCRGFRLSYDGQLQKKAKVLQEQCGQFGRFEPITGMENPYYYRNKVHAVFGEDRRHNIISGIYEEGTHRIVPVDSCLLENQKADAIIVSIRGLLKSFKIRPYNEDMGYGLLRHVLIRTGHATGEIMVVLVLTSPILPSKNNFVTALLKQHPEITTIVLNVNNKDTSMILGEKEIVLYGKGYIEDILLGKTFRISSRSFYQVNPVQTEKLYRKAIAYAALSGRETVLDAYCGTGTIGLIASDSAKEVIGVELNPAAVKDARINAKQNRVSNIMFYEKDAGEFIEQMAEQQAAVDVVFMDPPRAGSTERFLDALAALKPKRIVYVSCNPETLARDMQYLKRKGYRMAKGAGVDMFPWTSSIEAVVLLTPQKR